MAAADNPFYVRPANALEVLMSGVGAYDKAQMGAGQRAAEEALSRGDAQGALAKLLGVGAAKGSDLAHYVQNTNGVYGTPIMLQKPDGTWQVGAIGKSGEGRIVNFGEGLAPTVPSKSVDTGTGTLIVPGRIAGGGVAAGNAAGAAPNGGQPVAGAPAGVPGQYIPKDVAGEAEQKKYGTEQGDKLASLGKAQSSLQSSTSSLDRLETFATRLRDHPGLGGITGIKGYFPNIPGGDAANANALLTTLKSQVGFGALQAMRDASKTGGALGQVSDAEGVRLENAIAALDRAQDLPSFQRALNDIVSYTKDAKQRLQGAYQTDYGNLRKPSPEQSGRAPIPMQQPQPVRVNTPEEARRLPSGTPIVLPDGSIGRVP